ncbi:MAG: YkgJ family cysteine cluster protein [Desulfobacteraceae bacterium]|nr:MAG: YkgJ family cysteine cluster protein [Desulfobacteraceae bacterium]
MTREGIFLTSQEALRAVRLDFRGYGAQPMLFCEILRMVFGPDRLYQREPGKEGLWIAEGLQRMRWLEGSELIEYMCTILNEAELPPDRLAALCRLVFQAPCRPEDHSETGRAGIRVQTDMEAFACRQCGQCCRSLAYHDGITAQDVAKLKECGRLDILEWVGQTQTAEGQTVYRIWITPGSNQFAVLCPFLKSGPSPERWLCSIHDVKPTICRNYPVSRKHALMTGCPGFDTI